jgi:predicted XRE-type DNA-binding protein
MKIEKGSKNVYADLGMPDADEMLIKAQLVTKIREIIRGRNLVQQEAAALLGMKQPRLSNMLRGDFQGISERKMLDCLTRLGNDVKVLVEPVSKARTTGRFSVVFADKILRTASVRLPRAAKHPVLAAVR